MRKHFALAAATIAVLGGTVGAPAAAQGQAAYLAANCANCHGTEGRSAVGMPALAGQPKAYLIQQMSDFKAGKRPATIMHQLAKGYTDAQIEQMADYFSRLPRQ
jgi:cytochrome c553